MHWYTNTRWQTVVQLVSFAMITGLFFVWLVFGATTVQRQNANILRGVQQQLNEALANQQTFITQNTIGDRTIVCILQIDPTKRTEHVIQRCEDAARKGLDHLP